ncbi:hypothetical protein FN846DRAFT_1002284, partial [Sphaerosporella brunnea]
APPLDYVEPVLTPTNTGGSRPGSPIGEGRVTPFTKEGSMAKRIGYSALAATAVANASPFPGNCQKLREKGSRAGTPQGGQSTNATPPPPGCSGTLFFRYLINPVKAGGDHEAKERKPSMFPSGGCQTLRDTTNKKRK